MAELEKVYYSGESYRMAVVRSKINTILVNVYKMIRGLREMAGGRYTELEEIFDKISCELSGIIERKPEFRDGPFILPLGEVTRRDREQVGEKMANLGELSAIPSLLVPPGFVVTATATRRFLTGTHIDEINRRLQTLDPDDMDGLYRACSEIKKMIIDSPLPAELEEMLVAGYRSLEEKNGPGCLVALRSSGLGEDSAGVSFAGLYRTILDVDRERLTTAYKEVVAGKYGARAIAYRRKRGYRHEDIEMCVGCLAMVDAVVSGVTYSRVPGGEEAEVMSINAVKGVGRGVVDGIAATDFFLLARNPPYSVVRQELGHGAFKNEHNLAEPILNTEQLRLLAEKAIVIETYFGEPQDIEWSFAVDGTLNILQSRPMMRPDPAAKKETIPAPAAHAEGELPFLTGGVCAAAGIASGQVFHVNSDEEMRTFPNGAMLVLEHPLPEWAPLVSRAAAVIAETGSEAGHLATISREFGIPALFGVSGVRQRLVQGDIITINSQAKSLYHGVREDLLSQRGVKRDIMAGSPVQRILTEALQLITPLNLNDPTSLQFKSSWCETLHDITRFCHEKSVAEMFTLGRGSHFDPGGAKRLVGDVPLEWWVIDLADGFKPGVANEAGTIRIDEIVSEPMLAIWQGISAYPWQGPPPISAKGFGSIIFQSAMRPDIDPSVATPLTTKNYFLISANFCNLSVRLGYHYAMIEAYLSDLLTESYVTFRFKGGAADTRRKAVRAKLLAEILQHYGFRVELRSDALLARVKKQSAEYLRERLRILGYLTLHARQLDMVMTQPQAVERYRQKFRQEIDAMLAIDAPVQEYSSGG